MAFFNGMVDITPSTENADYVMASPTAEKLCFHQSIFHAQLGTPIYLLREI